MPCGATQDRRVMVERSDRMWPTGEGNGKPLQYSCLENSMNSESESRSVRLFATSWTIQSNEFSRPECLLWSLNLISDSSAFSKSSLNMWKFSVHVLSKPCLENFEHYFATMWDECNCVVVWNFFGTAFLWTRMKTDVFRAHDPYCVFQICWHIECSTFTASSFKIWNNSTRIPSPPLAFFVVMLPIWLCTPGCLVLGELSHHCGCLGHEGLFCIVFQCIFATSS